VSKARLVITAVVVECRSPSEVAAAYRVSRSWVYQLVARYRVEGPAAFEPRSRRPKTSPRALPEATVELIVELRKNLAGQGLDAGPDTIRWHLRQRHGLEVSRASIARHLARQGLVTPQPAKRPKTSYVRFAAELPNECWQADFTHYRLTDGTDTEILCFIDDHSRYAISVTAHRTVTGPTVVEVFRHAVAVHGPPASTLTDNGMVFTTRLSGGRGGRNGFESELRRLGIRQKNSSPGRPTTCGKVERFHQTLKRWLAAQPHQPHDLNGLQVLLDTFVHHYNQRRPHRSLPHQATPATAYHTRPKATPTGRDTDTHHRVRHDRIDDSGTVTVRHNGRLHHIGLGRTHARTPVILLIADRDIRIINATTSELLRHLTLDPTRDYQPTGKPPGPPPPKQQQPDPNRGFGLSGMS
jgi:transposase InsO family protein